MRKIRLDTLEKNQLDARAMNAVKGGNICGCACAYEGKGGSDTEDNSNANIAENKISNGYRLGDCKIITWGDAQWKD